MDRKRSYSLNLFGCLLTYWAKMIAAPVNAETAQMTLLAKMPEPTASAPTPSDDFGDRPDREGVGM
jgi:hypothetical protein